MKLEMPRATKSIFAALMLAALFACAAQKAQADPLILTITNSGQVSSPGSSVTLTGFYTNPGTQPFITSGFGIANPTPYIIFNSTVFTFPTVAPLSSTANAPLLTIFFANDTPLGIYDFFFYVQGYGPSGPPPHENSNAALFRVTVVPQPVPEPATVLLLITGLAGMAMRARRR